MVQFLWVDCPTSNNTYRHRAQEVASWQEHTKRVTFRFNV